MKIRNNIEIILIITILVLFLKKINVLQLENHYGAFIAMILMIILISAFSILIQYKIDNSAKKEEIHYQNLNVLKYICSILVILLHLRPFVLFSNQLDLVFNNMITRICVPIFFFITGYFVAQKEKEKEHYIKTYIKRTIPLYFVWNLFYLPVSLMTILSNLEVIRGYLSAIPIPLYYFLPLIILLSPLFLFLILCYTGFYYHLWYFPALLCSLLVLSKWKTKFSVSILCLLSFILLLFGATETYYGVLPPTFQEFVSYYFRIFFTTRNFLFFGLFYVVFGYVIGTKEKLYSKNCFLKMIICFLFLIFEVILLHDTKRLNSNILLSTIPLVYYLFLTMIYLPKCTCHFQFGLFSKYYYLVHPMVIFITSFLFKIENPYYHIFLVLGIIHIFALIIIKIKEKYRFPYL